MNLQDEASMRWFLARLELTLGWYELDNLITDGLQNAPQPNGTWRCWPIPRKRHLDWDVKRVAHNALNYARAMDRHAFDNMATEYTRAHVQSAKRVVSSALLAYCPTVCA